MQYFFDVAGAMCEPDSEGTEIATCADARVKAVQFASEMIRDYPDAILAGEELRIEVKDKQQETLFIISVQVEDQVPLNVSAWE